MANVAALSQHIFSLEPDKDAARLAFYQYLKNLCDATEQITTDLVNRFYLRALGFTHWQANKIQLFNEVEMLLQHYQDSTGIDLQLYGSADSGQRLFEASSLQVVAVENLRNLELVVQKNLEASLRLDDRVRILRDADVRVIAITLRSDRSLKVTSYQKNLVLQNGELSPLHSEMSVSYSPEMQLAPMTAQSLELGPHACAYFQIGQKGLRGNFVRGYTFQKFGSMDGGEPFHHPNLFYPLKRLEQFFIDKKTDPIYLELTQTLEQALEVIGQGANTTLDAKNFAQAALERGRLAIEHIFPDDKFANLLLMNLEKTLALAQAPKDDSWPEIKNLPV